MIGDNQGVLCNLLMPVNSSQQTGDGLKRFKYFNSVSKVQKTSFFTSDMCETLKKSRVLR